MTLRQLDTPARTRITKGPRATSRKRQVKFTFTANVSSATFQCRLTGANVSRSLTKWVRCSSPRSLRRLGPGKKTFSVRAVTAAGVGTAATHQFKIVKPKSKRKKKQKLPVSVIAFRGGKGTIDGICPLATRCVGTAVIKKGRAILAKGRYSIKPHSTRKYSLALTGAGRTSLSKHRRIKARGTLIGRSGARSQFIAILKRR